MIKFARSAFGLVLVLTALPEGYALAQSPPPFVTRGEPGAAHRALDPLVGDFAVEKTLYIAAGTPDRPVRASGLRTRREWIAGGRFLRDTTEGSVAGSPYFRVGTLGYSTMDRRYEWVTQDITNSNMMIYLGRPGSGTRQPIEVSGSFTDQGLLGEQNAGKPVRQRTLIRIDGPDRHTIELHFTPPDRPEFLADRSVYTRIK